MSKKIQASIILIGTELSTGKIQDKHGRYLSSILSGMGLDVSSVVIIPDNIQISKFIKAGKNNVDLLLVTGGLGPTSDDITRDAIAAAAGRELVFQDKVWQELIEGLHDSHFNESQKRQAYIPEGFTVIKNFCGTAPGFTGYIGSTLVYSLPGPPVEMHDMFERFVLPDITSRFELAEPESLQLSCFLICESALEDACKRYENSTITWGTRVQENKISLYLEGGSQKDKVLFFRYLQKTFGKELIVEGDKNAADILSSSLKLGGKFLSTAESITGGLVSKLITDIPGSSGVFSGGFVTYSNLAKKSFLGIPEDIIKKYSAVSREVVELMAENALKISSSDISLALSGYAGGNGDGAEDTGCVWIAVKLNKGIVFSSKFNFSGSRDLIRRKTAIAGILLAETVLRQPERLDSCSFWQYS